MRRILRNLLNNLGTNLDPSTKNRRGNSPRMSPRIGRILLSHPLHINVNSRQPELRILRKQRPSRSSDIGGLCGSRTGRIVVPGVSVVVAVARREESGEDAADQGAEEGEARADYGDVAFGGSPVGGCDVAP
jgi:hypothetical protein